MEVQVVEAQLFDSGISTGNNTDTFPPHEQKSTQKKYIETTVEKATKGRICFLSFFNCKQGNQFTC